ncbi:hypothetical protein V5O48_006678 [Marasmius crinis-equi]|uniref:F-box domain-containing protein n=1 Tax=Marasmius crinis-equi TaxID=585013 RepID=A0ABR3FIV5_9AGAR
MPPSSCIMDRIPREILSMIFEFASDIGRSNETFLLKSAEDSKPIIYSPHLQVRISHVCRSWRSVALGSPNLWNTLHFDKKSDIERGRTFCRRLSPITPMDILIVTVSNEEYAESIESGRCLLWEEELDEIFSVLAPLTPRWRTFHLQVRDGTCKKIARKYIGTQNGEICGAAPNLQTWQLYHFEDFRVVEDLHEATKRPPVTCFEDKIPNLKHLSLIGVNLPWHSPYLHGLHSLELCLHPDNIRPEFTHWHDMLSRSPDLRSLFLHYSGPKREHPWPKKPMIVLPRLENLGLVDLEPDYLKAITSGIEAANVNKLELELSDQEDDTVTYDDWLASISRPPRFQSLHQLTITALRCSDSTLKAFLATLPHLRELELEYSVWSNVWRIFKDDLKWREVTGSDGIPEAVSADRDGRYSSFLLPNLEVLKVRGTPTANHHRANVKLILRLREREGASARQQSPVPTSPFDRPLFTIVGTLPVQVLEPDVDPGQHTERVRHAHVLRRLVAPPENNESTLGTNGGNSKKSWKVLVDFEAITDEAPVEDDYDDEGGDDDEDDGGDDDEEEFDDDTGDIEGDGNDSEYGEDEE